MSGVNWHLLQSPAHSFQQSISNGMAMGRTLREAQDRKEYRGALGVLATDPTNANALASVFQYNPQAGIALADRADEMAFRRDVGEYVAPQAQPNALLAIGSPGMAEPAPQANALAPQSAAMPTPAAPQDETGGPDLSRLGNPQSREDAAFLRMLRRDPKEALKIKSAMRDNFVDQMQAESDFYGLAMGELSRAGDPASWSAALQSVEGRAQALGFTVMDKVPAEYPGPDGVMALMEKAQPIKQQLDLMLREANIDADNARSDRNTDSMIETRERRAAEYERANRSREGISRRGQDLTDRRSRTRGKVTAKGEKPDTELPVVASPEEAMKLPSGTRFKTPDGKVKVRP